MKNFYQLFATAAVLGFFAAMPQVSNAQTATTTFPVDQAGIAAYVKLGQLSLDNFENAKNNLFDYVENAGSAYLIGVKKYPVSDIEITNNTIDVRLYLGANGWLVAYLPKDQEPSRIVNWHSGQPLSNTILKVAVDDAVQKIGAAAAGPVNYYDFVYPGANKMTFARQNLSDTLEGANSDLSKTISIFVPGTLLQATYAIKSYASEWVPNNGPRAVLNLNNEQVAVCNPGSFGHGTYPGALFASNANNSIELARGSGIRYVSAATALIYKTN